MKFTTRKTIVSAAIGASLAVAALPANAWLNPGYSTTLIPYVVKDSNRTTVISLIMSDDSANTSGTLALQYWTKPISDPHNGGCFENAYMVPVTQNDVITFDSAGILEYPMFGDTTNPAAGPLSISWAGTRHGYLAVTPQAGSTPPRIAASYWTEIDFANGGSIGDQGISAYSTNFKAETSESKALMPDAYGTATHATAVMFWPSSYMTTSFVVTPLGTDMMHYENHQAAIQAVNSGGYQGVYDRNENNIDGTVPVNVRCVARVSLNNLLPGVMANAAWAAQGGWGYLANIGNGNITPGEAGDNPAIVYQVDQQEVGKGKGKNHFFMANATRIVTDH